MTRQDKKETARKIIWATQKDLGKKKGKKMVGEAWKIVETMSEPKNSGETTFKAELPQENSIKSLIDLSNLIGRDYGKK